MKKVFLYSIAALLTFFLSCSTNEVERKVQLKDCGAPTIQASKLRVVSFTDTTITLKCKPGNGEHRIVQRISHTVFHPNSIPVDGTSYPEGYIIPSFPSTSIVKNNSDTIFTITANSEPLPGYWLFKVFDYNVCDDYEYYNKGNILHVEPDNAVYTGNELTISWHLTDTQQGPNDSTYIVLDINGVRQDGWALRNDGEFTTTFPEQINSGDSIAGWFYATRNGVDSDLVFFPPVPLN